MFGLLLAAAMFLPHQTVKRFNPPLDDRGMPKMCISSWGDSMVQNICDVPVTVDVAFKNGQGRHFELDPFESHNIGNPKVPYITAACVKGQGSPSMSPDMMVRPGYKLGHGSYTCIQVILEFPYAGGQ